MKIISILSIGLLAITMFASAQEKPKADLGAIARDMRNPVSLHYMLPLQNNMEVGDVDNQFRYNLKVQPVVPFVVNKDWKIITRTIIPIIANQYNGVEGNGKSGLADMSLTGWIAPQKKVNGWVWGVGLAADLPTATEEQLGSGKWTAGPSALVVKELGKWSIGLLGNQVWSYAGSGAQDVNYAFVDLWGGYTFNSGFGINLESESVFDWASNEQTIPVRFGVSQVFMMGKQVGAINLDGLYYAVRPDYGAKWGVSLTFTLVFNRTVYTK